MLAAFVRDLPVIGPAAKAVWRAIRPPKAFPGSGRYWEERYVKGGNSGAGSYSRLAEFKAEFLNSFVERHGIRSVIEFGSGDGNQLKLATYPNYLGVDVSLKAVQMCQRIFTGDGTRSFVQSDAYDGQRAELSLSLDVIYHLVEDAVFDSYMRTLFDCADRFVIVYASNDEGLNVGQTGEHVRHRQFTNWIEKNAPSWGLVERVPNRYPYEPDQPTRTSFADFYVYRRLI